MSHETAVHELEPRDLPFHPATDVFPMIEDEDAYADLVDDIRQNGLREPIVIHEGQVIDGRIRQNACRNAAVEPRYVEWDGKGSLVAYIVSKNVHRRHLNASQRAMIAAQMVHMLAAEGEARRAADEKRTHLRSTEELGAILRSESKVAETAAKALNVSTRSVENANRVTRRASPRVQSAVKRGRVSVSDAAKIADRPHGEQDEALATVTSRRSKTLARAVAEPVELQTAVLYCVSTHKLGRMAKAIRCRTLQRVANMADQQGVRALSVNMPTENYVQLERAIATIRRFTVRANRVLRELDESTNTDDEPEMDIAGGLAVAAAIHVEN